MKVEPKKKLARYLPFSSKDEITAVTDSQARSKARYLNVNKTCQEELCQNKNAFQYDEYRPLHWASQMGVVCPGCLPRGVSSQEGVCLPGEVCIPTSTGWGVSTPVHAGIHPHPVDRILDTCL